MDLQADERALTEFANGIAMLANNALIAFSDALVPFQEAVQNQVSSINLVCGNIMRDLEALYPEIVDENGNWEADWLETINNLGKR